MLDTTHVCTCASQLFGSRFIFRLGVWEVLFVFVFEASLFRFVEPSLCRVSVSVIRKTEVCDNLFLVYSPCLSVSIVFQDSLLSVKG